MKFVVKTVASPKNGCNNFCSVSARLSVPASKIVANPGSAPHKASRQKANKQNKNMNTTAKQREYHSSMRRFMEHKDKCEYAKDESFTEEQLLAIQPSHIVAWFNFLAFGKEVPKIDDKPTGCRLNTLLITRSACLSSTPGRIIRGTQFGGREIQRARKPSTR